MPGLIDVDILTPSGTALTLVGSVPSVPASDRAVTPEHNTLGCLTEDEIALGLVERYVNRLRYCHSSGRWFTWNGNNWQVDTTRQASEVMRLLAREASQYADYETKIRVQKNSFIGGVNKLCQADPEFAVGYDAWDQDKFKLGTPTGTINLRNGSVQPPDPNDGITKATAVTVASSANCPQWLRFLNQTTGNDVALIRFLQQWCGYCLTGVTREHALVFVYGGGGNGKSVFLNTVTGILADYAVTAAMQTFIASHSEQHSTDLAMLRGARLVTASETEHGKAWAESRIKQLTGGDPITARFMRQDFFTYTPQFKLTIIGNHKPVLQNIDEAARRRFNIIPFIRRPDVPDRQLEDKLKLEWPGILRWMVDGCLDWQRNGLIRPSSIVDATNAYFNEQDLFGQWLEDRCDIDVGNATLWDRSADLFASWENYAEAAGEKAGNVRGFAEDMRKRGFMSKRTGTARGFSGIRLKPDRYDDDA
jgi:putative DNA primase/helicase